MQPPNLFVWLHFPPLEGLAPPPRCAQGCSQRASRRGFVELWLLGLAAEVGGNAVVEVGQSWAAWRQGAWGWLVLQRRGSRGQRWGHARTYVFSLRHLAGWCSTAVHAHRVGAAILAP